MTNENRVIIVVPYYHTDLSEIEIITLKQAQKIFKKYDLCYIAPLRLKSFWENEKNRVEYFEDIFFEDASTYNQLMLLPEFYKRFIKYHYMLIYQLDAFVFYDRLDYFCDLNYDYIGAPWIYPQEGMIGDIYQKVYVGNGGLSLRRVRSCIKLLRYRKEELRDFSYNEDFFFSVAKENFKVAPLSIALEFSIETHVRKCFEINGRRLPFGCHAWEKYDFAFWKPYIEEQGYDLSKMEIKTGTRDILLDARLEGYKYSLFGTMHLLPIILQKILEKEGFYQKRFSIWGAGKYGRQLLELLLQFGVDVDYIIDENPNLQGQMEYKIPIVSFSSYKSLNSDNVIIIAVKRYMDDIQKELEENNFIRKKDYISILELLDMFYIEVIYHMCKE